MRRAGITLGSGLREDERDAAARLYWNAFGNKLGRVLGPEPRALRFITRVIRDDHVIVARGARDEVLGVAGFKTAAGAFVGGTLADLLAVYGRLGGLWRAAFLALLERDVENRRFLMDGICVATEARGLGVGTALLEAICDEAIRRGYGAVRLDVIEQNARARALYERRGFRATGATRLGPLSWVFGFSKATTMVRDLTLAS